MKFFVVSALAGSALAQTAGSGLPGADVMPRLSEQSIVDGGIRKTIKYGPYVMPANKMVTKTARTQPPCSNCYITAIEATIRNLDGTEANADQGAWLHHVTLSKGYSMFWAAGNERPTLRLNRKHKYGLDLDAGVSPGFRLPAGGARPFKRQLGGMGGTFTVMTDLMSMAAQDQEVTLDITYEWIPKTNTAYKGAKMEWLTVGEPKAREGHYKFDSQRWTAPWDAHLLYAIGHMHDGGTHSSLFVDNTEVCRSLMYYDAREGYTSAGDDHSHDMGGAAGHSHVVRDAVEQRARTRKRDGPSHLSDPGVCENFGTIKAGQQMRMEGWYDTSKYPLMGHNGKLENLMANMRVYLGPA